MAEEVTKTLEATLVPPTQGKAVRLRRLLSTYREALQDAFDSGADTMNGVSDVVTPFDLPYQAKAALCSYVPKLRKTYNARELDDEHPLRLTNQAAKFDWDESRHHEICWNVPLPGYGTNFWIPLRVNPEQESLWHDLLNEDAKAGQIRLQQNRNSWVLHVTVTYSVEGPETDDDETYIGFDIGESALITGCALKRNTPTKPMLETGSRARQLRKEMFTTLKRLQERDAAEWRIDERFDHYQNALTDIVEKASREAVEYAKSFEDPAIVLEDLSYIRENLDYGKFMNRRLHAWAFARLQGRIEDKATEAGIPVRFVNPRYTSQTCHECSHIGRRSQQAEFKCTNDDCHVTEFHADINAAANIASRVDPWGESVPWEPERDDSPRNGSASDSATVHRETSEQSSQMTLAAYSD
ncbi:IS200/IS605 family element transposase accessory protein TnpB [Natronococcus sp. JC468]|uniref:RNA-guided endonuclease TnpB family protein n=1 Tax=Natronococcus sp. JC468 TaxID=1961921 RepID=UPI00143AB65C|nr:RNA-guided endonuclease TnpB family protein [Natronococcus sp. JC468]NKE36524.1 IS200/IS605 family element transposase accessory protein TnpB [Natronococcus sp. JC468]